MNRIIAITMAFLLCANLSAAFTLHVPSQYPTIQAGINASSDGDTVLVAAGIYHENINFSGREIVVRSDDPPNTVIDGDSLDTVVRIISGEGTRTVLEGFTITNGYSIYVGSAGIHIASGAAPTIRGNIIEGNGAWWSALGGGISADQSNPVIERNQITNNECVYEGGGIHLLDCTGAVVRNNTISGNFVCSGYGVSVGVGIYLDNSTAVIENNIIVNNVGLPPSHGGGLYLVGSSTIDADFNDLWNNTPPDYWGCTPGDFDLNADPLFVGGIPYSYELNSNSPCIDAGAFTSEPDPDGTRADMGSYYFNQGGINVAIVPDLWPIVIPATGGRFRYDLHVTNHTVAPVPFDLWIDTRDPGGTITTLMVREGITFAPEQHAERYLTQTIPGGALSGTHYYMAHTGDYSIGDIYHETIMPFTKLGSNGLPGQWSLEGWDELATAKRPTREQIEVRVSPNPFNPTTTLSFNLPESDRISLKIYDITGRIVANILDRELEAGAHVAHFNASHLTSGVYLAVLETGDTRMVKRLLQVK